MGYVGRLRCRWNIVARSVEGDMNSRILTAIAGVSLAIILLGFILTAISDVVNADVGETHLPQVNQIYESVERVGTSDRFTITFPLAQWLYVILLTDTETGCEWVIVQDYHGYDMNTEPIPNTCLGAQ